MILEGEGDGCQGWGLALLLHRGFLAWIEAFSKIALSQEPLAGPALSMPDLTDGEIPDTIRGRMVMTISEMVLSTLQGVIL